ncbi:nucleoside deaminase [Endomicrobium proavitum]|uniref:Cytidine/deoxycytidylate deaminase, zinc-binding region n=1 Tax=Endomicrobium proavitum TaxID=1408281 RepID=A0A0G3WIJ0_9BACT|nr:nucleoside deaminase [Endomicrobium proavitum]AKL97697.1 cytidine/deoxycytidylate deaminase, zinc-binding region [Endomicrobium proavitum]
MKKTKNNFIEISIKVAEGNVLKNLGGPFGAVVVKNGKVIAAAGNSVTKKNDPTAHAEIEAIRKAAKKLKTFDLSSCEIYSSCKPCPMCLSAIYWANIKKIYYAANSKAAARAGFRDDFIYKEFAKPAEKRKIKEAQQNAPSKNNPFKLWKKSQQKVKY